MKASTQLNIYHNPSIFTTSHPATRLFWWVVLVFFLLFQCGEGAEGEGAEPFSGKEESF